MRKPHNDPVRRCIITGDRGARSGLVRLALGPDGVVMPDVRARAPGRGAWIGVDRANLEAALSKGKLQSALGRALKSSVVAPADLPALTERALARNALDRLGLEARAGNLITGSERIESSARAGQVHLLLHAEDAGEDGRRKLDQAWRTGLDQQGSGLEGCILSIGRDALSAALGRANVVHIALSEAGAAERVSTALDRWHYFIGRKTCSALAKNGVSVHGDAAHELLEGIGFGE